MIDKRYENLVPLDECSDDWHRPGRNGVARVSTTKEGSVEYICFENGQVLGYVKSASGYPAYYPVAPTRPQRPVKAVMMDLDGTTVKSEPFWIWIIQLVVQSLGDLPHFSFAEEDLPFVSGHSVTEHLLYCIQKYCPGASLEEARRLYFQHVEREMQAIEEGHGKKDAFVMAPGVLDFLKLLKARGIKIGLVTSGLYGKAYPEILAAFSDNGLGRPEDFYDCIITAGFPLGAGRCGTLGELAPKPHPWLYAEAGAVGLGIPYSERQAVLAIEDSAAGIHSIHLAGYPCCGIGGGNIRQGGAHHLCDYYFESFDEIVQHAL